MRFRWICTLLAGAAAAGVLAGPGSAAALETRFPSEALDATMHVRIVLPPGYATSGLRYPVVYLLHGLPAGPFTYAASQWLDRTMQALPRQVILVEPQGAREGDSDPEYLDWGPGRDWETYIARDLPNWVDAHFRTIPSRSGRAIVGFSAGGYGASLVGFDHLDRFSVIESWSGYFHPTNPAGTARLDRGSAAANARASVHDLVRDDAAAHRLPTFFGFYVGRGDLRFHAANVQLNQELDRAHVPHVFAVYPGGHTTALWETHAREWLGMAVEHLAAPITVR